MGTSGVGDGVMVGEGVMVGVEVGGSVAVGVEEGEAEGMGVGVWVGAAVSVLLISGDGIWATIVGIGSIAWRLQADRSAQQAARDQAEISNRDPSFLMKAGRRGLERLESIARDYIRCSALHNRFMADLIYLLIGRSSAHNYVNCYKKYEFSL